MPTSLQEMTKVVTNKGEVRYYKAHASPYADVLIALDHTGGYVEDKSGRASNVLKDACQTRRVREMTQSAFSGLQGRLEEAGWINRTIRGKRTYRIGLSATIPSDVSDWLVFEADEKPAINGKVPTSVTQTAGPSAEPVEPVTDDRPAPVVDDAGADELGMRPGRLAARLEQSIPEIVEATVVRVIQQDREAQMAALGYYPTIPREKVAEMEAELEAHDSVVAQLRTTIQDLNEERNEREAIIDLYLDQEDERLVKTNEGQAAGKGSLTVHQVRDPLKGLARAALSAGWTIKNTRGGHLLWRSPQGKAVFSGTTTHSNAVNIMRRKLRRQGLVFEGRDQEMADVDHTGGHRASTNN